jgi:hypothetical protein
MSKAKNQLFVVAGKKNMSAKDKERIKKIEKHLKALNMGPVRKTALREATLPDHFILIAANPLAIIIMNEEMEQLLKSNKKPRRISLN